MHIVRLTARPWALAVLLAPLACAADGLLRGSLPTAARTSAEPPGVQVSSLPSGALMRRLPGPLTAGDPKAVVPAGTARLAAGVSVQQSGAAQLQVLGGAPSAAATATAPVPGVTVRQSGAAQLREMTAPASPARVAVAAATAGRAGVVIADLAAEQPLPANPAPATLYRRLPAVP